MCTYSSLGMPRRNLDIIELSEFPNMPEDNLSQMYPHIPREKLQDLKAIGASSEQFERSDAACKIETDCRLASYILEDESLHPHPDLNVVVIGVSGSGKSATGNTLLGEKWFKEGASATSVTTQAEVHGSKQLTVKDTPGSWNVEKKDEHISMYAIVINLASPRFTRKDLSTIRNLQDRKSITKSGRCFLLLTHASEALQGKSLSEYLHEIRGDPLHDLIVIDMGKCKVMAINNSYSTPYETDKQREMIGNIIGKAYQDANFQPSRFQLPLPCFGGSNQTSKEDACIIIIGITVVIVLVITVAIVLS